MTSKNPKKRPAADDTSSSKKAKKKTTTKKLSNAQKKMWTRTTCSSPPPPEGRTFIKAVKDGTIDPTAMGTSTLMDKFEVSTAFTAGSAGSSTTLKDQLSAHGGCDKYLDDSGRVLISNIAVDDRFLIRRVRTWQVEAKVLLFDVKPVWLSQYPISLILTKDTHGKPIFHILDGNHRFTALLQLRNSKDLTALNRDYLKLLLTEHLALPARIYCGLPEVLQRMEGISLARAQEAHTQTHTLLSDSLLLSFSLLSLAVWLNISILAGCYCNQ
jgi:hypothetical protein